MDVWPSWANATSSMNATSASLRVIDGNRRSREPTAESQLARDKRKNRSGWRAGSSAAMTSRSCRQAAPSNGSGWDGEACV
jgi:hypothetical protein